MNENRVQSKIIFQLVWQLKNLSARKSIRNSGEKNELPRGRASRYLVTQINATDSQIFKKKKYTQSRTLQDLICESVA